MRCAANNAGIVNGVSYGNDPNNRCVGTTVRRRWWILGSQSRLLVIRCVLTLGYCRHGQRSDAQQSLVAIRPCGLAPRRIDLTLNPSQLDISASEIIPLLCVSLGRLQYELSSSHRVRRVRNSSALDGLTLQST